MASLVLLVAAGLTFGSPTPAQAVPTAVITSSLRSLTTHTCLDVSTTDPANYFLDTYGTPCTGSAPQTYQFTPVTGTPAHTYTLTSTSTGQCLTSYRFGIRQGSCALSTARWTFVRLSRSGSTYHMEPTYTISGSTASCIRVAPRPSGYPGTLWDHTSCASVSNQVIAVRATL